MDTQSQAKFSEGFLLGRRVLKDVAIALPMKMPIKVIPGSSCDCIAGWRGNVLKVRVKAKVKEKGKKERQTRLSEH